MKRHIPSPEMLPGSAFNYVGITRSGDLFMSRREQLAFYHGIQHSTPKGMFKLERGDVIMLIRQLSTQSWVGLVRGEQIIVSGFLSLVKVKI